MRFASFILDLYIREPDLHYPCRKTALEWRDS